MADALSTIFTPEVTNAVAQAVISLLGVLLTAALTVVIKFVRTKTTAEQFAYLQHAAAVAVSASEQLGLSGVIEDKKGVALGMLERELALRGIKVPAEALDAAIEAAVLDAFNLDRTGPSDSVDADIVQPGF